ncbi:hypothetical protein D9M70_450440 [compost metagenome]
MHADAGEQLRIRLSHHDGHRRACGQACHEDAARIHAMPIRNLLHDAGDQRGLARTAALVLRLEPVPAFRCIGLRRLFGIDHQKTVRLRQPVHLRACCEIVRRLRAAMQHDDQRTRGQGLVCRHEKLVGPGTCLAAELVPLERTCVQVGIGHTGRYVDRWVLIGCGRYRDATSAGWTHCSADRCTEVLQWHGRGAETSAGERAINDGCDRGGVIGGSPRMEGVFHGYFLKVKRFCRKRSANAFGQGPPHGGTGLEGSQHGHRLDGSGCQLRSDVVRDAREPDHLNLQALTGSHRAFKILSS